MTARLTDVEFVERIAKCHELHTLLENDGADVKNFQDEFAHVWSALEDLIHQFPKPKIGTARR